MPELPSRMGSFSVSEAAFLTHLGLHTIRSRCQDGLIKCHKTSPNGHRRIVREALVEYMHRQGIPLDLACKGVCPQARAYPPGDFAECRKQAADPGALSRAAKDFQDGAA